MPSPKLELPAGWESIWIDCDSWAPVCPPAESESDIDTILNGLLPAFTKPNLFHACDFTYWTAQKQQQLNAAKSGTTLVEKEDDFIAVDSGRGIRPTRGGTTRFHPRGGKTFYNQTQARVQVQQNRPPGMGSRPMPRMNARGGFNVGGKKDKLSSAYQHPRNANQNNRWNSVRTRAVMAEYAVEIDAEWQLVSEVALQTLSANPLNVKEIKIEDVAWRGKVREYNKDIDRIKPRTARLLPRQYSETYTYTQPGTREDPVLPTLFDSYPQLQVIATSQLLTTLMAAVLSRYGWQLVVYKFGDKLILEKSDRSSALDILTINETAEVKSKEAGVEAAKTNIDFQQMCIEGSDVVVEEAGAEFDTREDFPPNRLYRYRMVTLPPGRPTPGTTVGSARKKPITLAVRTEINAAGLDEEKQVREYISVHAFNEGKSSSSAWAQNLERQKGALLVTELRNNACKIAKWVYESLLAGVQTTKIGFLSKKQDKDDVILTVQSSQVAQLCAQMSLKLPNAWGVVREIIDIILTDQEEFGQYFVTRDALNPVVKIHRTEIPDEEEDEHKKGVIGGDDQDSD